MNANEPDPDLSLLPTADLLTQAGRGKNRQVAVEELWERAANRKPVDPRWLLGIRGAAFDPDPFVRDVALCALGEVGKAQDERLLRASIYDPYDVARASAVESLGLFRTTSSAKTLLSVAVREPDWFVRRFAYCSLADFEIKELEPFYLARFEAEEGDNVVRCAIVYALGLIGNFDHLDLLDQIIMKGRPLELTVAFGCALGLGNRYPELKPLMKRLIDLLTATTDHLPKGRLVEVYADSNPWWERTPRFIVNRLAVPSVVRAAWALHGSSYTKNGRRIKPPASAAKK